MFESSEHSEDPARTHDGIEKIIVYTFQRIRQRKSNRPPSKYLNFCNHVSSPSSRNSGTTRPCSITPNFSIHNGRHSVIGAPFLNSPPFAAIAVTGGAIGGDDSPTTSLGRQRSSIDSTAELDCIPSLPYDAVSSYDNYHLKSILGGYFGAMNKHSWA